MNFLKIRSKKIIASLDYFRLKFSWWIEIGTIFFLCLFYLKPVFADGDPLSGLMTTLQATFGTSSTFVHVLYLAEVVTGIVGFIKSKHPYSFVGIVLVTLFMTFALNTWVFTS